MQIGKDYRIESDALNIILYRRIKGKETWLVKGYFATMEGALKTLVDMELMGTRLKDIKTMAKKQDEIYSLINRLGIKNNARTT